MARNVFAVTAGEDYELLVTLPGEFAGADEFARVYGIGLTRIGSVAPGAGVRATLAGKVRSVHGFRHAV